MNKSILREKSYAFALRIVKLCRYLVEQKKEFILSKQILRSGTSIERISKKRFKDNQPPILSANFRFLSKNLLKQITGFVFCGMANI